MGKRQYSEPAVAMRSIVSSVVAALIVGFCAVLAVGSVNVLPAAGQENIQVEQVSAGSDHSCAVRTGGTLLCWGSDDWGEALPPVGTFRQISTAWLQTCGIRTDDTIACWGLNSRPQPPAGTYSQVSISDAHYCAVATDGTPVCWGGTNYVDPLTPPEGLSVTQISTGTSHACAVQTNGTPICWGQTDHGRARPPEGLTVTAVSAGDRHSCAIQTDATPVCWGWNEFGESDVPEGLAVSSISAAEDFTCATKVDGGATCWGKRNIFHTEPPADLNLTGVSSDTSHSCAVQSDGTPICWGSNYSGQLDAIERSPVARNDRLVAPLGYPTELNICANDSRGDGVTALEILDGELAPGLLPGDRLRSYDGICRYRGTPTEAGVFTARYRLTDIDGETAEATVTITIEGPSGPRFSAISAGSDHTCAIQIDGTPDCWGDNSFGAAIPPDDLSLTQISAGWNHTCAVSVDGEPVCWGRNGSGESNPPEGLTLTQVSAGNGHSCGVTTDATAVCWGDENYGRIAVPDGITVSQISAGRLHTCAVRTDGIPVCWGDDAQGKATPPAGITVTQISAGDSQTCAVQTDGSPICWGSAFYGEGSPPDGITVATISVGRYNACAMQTDGTPICWGRTSHGEASLPGVVEISVGDRFRCALQVDGQHRCWGNNDVGQVGPDTRPVAENERVSGVAYTVFSFDPCANDTPGDGDTRMSLIGGNPSFGLTVVSDDAVNGCSVTGVLTEPGVFTYRYRIVDRDGDSSDAVATISIDPPPAPIDPLLPSLTSTSGFTTCAVLADSSVGCWGNNYSGKAAHPEGLAVTQVSVGTYHACAIQTDATPICWGSGAFAPDDVQVSQLSVGVGFNCAVELGGVPRCWGSFRGDPLDPPAGVLVVQVSASARYACAVQVDGTPICWGTTISDAATPPAGLTVSQIDAGSQHSCAVQIDGTPICWGSDVFGQASPPAGLRVTQVSVGLRHSCAVASDGTPTCWGSDTYGQATPPAGLKVTQVSAGHEHTCAVATDGSTVCWGSNRYGQLGERLPQAIDDVFAASVGTPASFDLCANDTPGNRETRVTRIGGSYGPGLVRETDYELQSGDHLRGCIVSGTPTAVGTFTFDYRLTDLDGDVVVAKATFTITASDGGVDPDPPGVIEEQVIEAEEYNAAGFFDADVGNAGGAYRTDDVDVFALKERNVVVPGEFVVGRTRDGEWLEYTIDVAADGEFDVAMRFASAHDGTDDPSVPDAPGRVVVSVDGVAVGDFDVTATGGWWSFAESSIARAQLGAGVHVVRLDIVDGYFNIDRLTVSEDADSGVIHLVPGLFEAEDYDVDDSIDSTEGNTGGAYRSDDVDVYRLKERNVVVPGKYVVGATRDGERLEYVITTESAGRFALAMRYASAHDGTDDPSVPDAPGRVVVSLDGVQVGDFDVSATGGWWTFAEPTVATATLSAGTHVIRLDIVDGYFNIDRFTVTEVPEDPVVGGFACAADAGTLTWTDDGQAKYWVYKKPPGTDAFVWLGKTLGATTIDDPNPAVGTEYQVHYQGIDRVQCTITAEPSDPEPALFACAANAGTLTWTDAGQSKYWVYKKPPGTDAFVWLGKTLGATTIDDPNPAMGTEYQVHYQGIPRTSCTTVAEPSA